VNTENVLDKHVKRPTFAIDQHVWLYCPRPLVRQKKKQEIDTNLDWSVENCTVYLTLGS